MSWVPPSAKERQAMLDNAGSVAIVGASANPARASNFVATYLLSSSADYDVHLINPRETEILGRPVYPSLQDLPVVPDIVDVFRASGNVPEHLDEILAMDPRPKVVWLQLGIENHEVAAALRAEGITVVQDRCTLADHRALGLGPVA